MYMRKWQANIRHLVTVMII